MKLEDSPHYKFIYGYHHNSSKNEHYREYINCHMDKKNIFYKEKYFIDLYKSIKKDIKSETSKVEVFCLTKDLLFTRKFLLCDGVHRASILKTLNATDIKVNLVTDLKIY